MDAECEHDLSAMMVVVPHEIPDDLPPREHTRLAVIRPFDDIGEIGGGPALQARTDDLPGGFKPISEFGRSTDHWRRRLIGAIPVGKRIQFIVPLAEYPMGHAGASSDDVGCQ